MDESPYSNPVTAAVYERTAARFQFAAPGGDLVEVVGVTQGGIVLDVGTGTGVVAAAAKSATGTTGMVVGVDSSIEMVRLAGNDTGFVLADACSLPFSGETFDVVIAGFVVSHFHDHL